ncbi:MAG: transcriptional repressor [Myxococcota bacterium]
MDPRIPTLREAGLRATVPRLRVLGALLDRNRPSTHADLTAELPDLDPVTLYRVLDSLWTARLVHRVQGLDGAWRYCPHPARKVGGPGNHVHFYCMECGALTCLDDQPMPRVTPPAGATVELRQFLACGRCATCAAAAAPE